MRLTSVSLYSHESEIANFEFENPSSTDSFIARAIMGLDVPEVVPKFIGFGANRSKQYEFYMPPREIVLRLILNPNRQISQSFSSLRDDLYRAISAYRGGELSLRFNSGVPWYAYIMGMITKVETVQFAKDQEVQITFLCEDPIFRAYNSVRTYTDGSPTGLDPYTLVDSISTGPHGFEIELVFTENKDSFYIQDSVVNGPEPDWVFNISFDFLENDVLTINSRSDVRSITVRREITPGFPVYNTFAIADKITPTSVWPLIHPGTNNIIFSDPDAVTLTYIEYTPEFWGI